MPPRIPRRHRFRTTEGAEVLFRRLPRDRRFRLAAGADGAQRFGASPVAVIDGDAEPGIPKQALRRALPRVPDTRRSGFPGGALGYVAYERGYGLENLAPRAGARDSARDVWFGVYDTFATFDPARGEVEITSWGWRDGNGFDERTALRRAEALERRLRGGGDPHAGTAADEEAPPPGAKNGRESVPARASLDALRHADAVAQVLEAIRRGDIYQANLTARFDAPTSVVPLTLFERLLRDNPAPFATFLETDHGTVISCSPERMLAASGRDIETRPIKGTSARADDPVRDAALAAELLASPKNRAELLMITDLLRNDFGKVCAPGTVHVPRLVGLESFPHLHHLASTIVGRLRPGLDALDALEAVFPCGSVTGAPKRRAMEILRDLEPAPRGVYTGTVGWVGFDRSADFAVAIRTGVLADGVFSFGSGGGIVIDSDAASEWDELLLKARAFALALALGADADGASREGTG